MPPLMQRLAATFQPTCEQEIAKRYSSPSSPRRRADAGRPQPAIWCVVLRQRFLEEADAQGLTIAASWVA
jgi:hypothetical protein